MPGPYIAPLSAPYDTLDTAALDERVDLKYRVILQTSPTTAIVLITWSKFGIVDCKNTIVHKLDITEGSTTTTVQLDEAQAYNNRYCHTISNWDLSKAHRIVLSINFLYTKILDIPAAVKAPLDISVAFNDNQTVCKYADRAAGIGIKIMTCQLNLDKDIKNVYIHKLAGQHPASTTLPLYAVRSVPVSVTLPSNPSDYSSAVIAGVTYTSISTPQFNSIYNDRKKVMFSVSYSDGNTNYIEETSTDVIKYTQKADIIDVLSFSNLSTTIHNNYKTLYHTIDTDKYYLYRPNTSSLPIQGSITIPTPSHTWVSLSDLDPDNDGTFDVPVPGTRTISITAIRLKVAVMNSVGDYLTFSTQISTCVLDTVLATAMPGVKFMRDNYSHIDQNVTGNAWYTYETIIEFWSGLQFKTGVKVVKHESINDPILQSNNTLDDLSIPATGDSRLTEYDFQSGIGTAKAFLSYSKEDYDTVMINKILEKHCGCDWPEACDGK